VEYKTFEELKSYMYLVACAVGFLCLKIFGWTGKNSREYATYLGYAVQLTNIIRDIASDLKMNRIYIPCKDMQKFGYTKTDLKNLVYNDNFIELMKFEAQRSHVFYRQAYELVKNGNKSNLKPAFIMSQLYERLLTKIEKSGFKFSKEKISLTPFEKSKSIINAFFIY
jgi:phytoene synthase